MVERLVSMQRIGLKQKLSVFPEDLKCIDLWNAQVLPLEGNTFLIISGAKAP